MLWQAGLPATAWAIPMAGRDARESKQIADLQILGMIDEVDKLKS
jgi:hypothetical protein